MFFKVFIVLVLMFSSFSAFSASREYEPAFHKSSSEKNSVEFQEAIQKDTARFHSLFFKKSKSSIQIVKHITKKK